MRYVSAIFLLFSALTAWAAADVHSQSTGAQWLALSDAAMKAQSYRGTLVYLKNGQLEAMSYQHGFDHGEEFERLSSLNSPLREVLRKANEIKCHFKETRQTVDSQQPVGRSMIVNLPAAPQQLDAQYLYAIAGQEMVAMHPAQVIAVLPKDDLRYARKLWIDEVSFLPLKVEIYDQRGSILEQVMFTSISIDEAGARAPTQTGSPQQVEISTSFEHSQFKLQNWPAGFEMLIFSPSSLGKEQGPVDRLLLSDGFSNISLYFERKSAQSHEGARNFGLVNSYSHIVGDYLITALGEVPAKTVQFIVEGVTLR